MGFVVAILDLYVFIPSWKAIIPFFLVKRPWPFLFVITALIVWSHFCESCYGFLRPFFNKMSKKYGFAAGRLVWELLRFFTAFFNKMLKNTVLLRVGLQCSFDLNIFLVITGKNNILPKKCSLRLFPQWPDVFVFLALQLDSMLLLPRLQSVVTSPKLGWDHLPFTTRSSDRLMVESQDIPRIAASTFFCSWYAQIYTLAMQFTILSYPSMDVQPPLLQAGIQYSYHIGSISHSIPVSAYIICTWLTMIEHR